MSIVAELTLQALKDCGVESLPHYELELTRLCKDFEPTFGKKWYLEKYINSCTNQEWFINSLVSNAAKEGEGSKQLWNLSGKISDTTLAELVRIHAIDEMRHGKFYFGMLKYTFINKNLHLKVEQTLNQILPSFKPNEFPNKQTDISYTGLIDEFVQINIGEIRTRIHQLMLNKPLLAYAPKDNHDKLSKIINRIILDETNHIAYTAKFLNHAISNGYSNFVKERMDFRWQEFNNITYEEVEYERMFAPT